MSRSQFFLVLLRRHALSYLAGLVMLGLTLGMTVSIPRYLQEAIDILRGNPDPAGREFLSRITWILVFAVAIIATRTGSRLLFFTPGRHVEFDLKNQLLEHLTGLQRDFYLKNPSGAIISRINNDVTGVRMMMGFGLLQVASSFGALSLAPYYMYRISPALTLYSVLPVLGAFGLLQWGTRRLRGEQMNQMHALQALSDFTVESYNGIDVLKSYRHFGWVEGRFTELSHAVRNSAIRMSNLRSFLMPVLNHIGNGLKVFLVFYGGVMVVRQGMTMGQFMAYALYLAMLVPPLMGLTFLMFMLQRGLTAMDSLEAVLHMQPGLPPPRPESQAALPAELRQGLRVRGLSFAYPDDPGRKVLDGVSFEVRPGEIVGVFGTIGSGKSTLINLINGYLGPPPGAVFLDGVDVTELGHALLRRHVVTVTQEPFLFSATIRENIALAARGLDDAAVERAARAAALGPDLKRLPAGLDTQVGEKGITLSGGQKQRIALARTLLKPCDLLILDDVLSAVDHDTERYLIDQIYGFRHARALLIVSHRISALERARRILVLDAGRLVDVGTHEELTLREGPYRQAWLIQSEQLPSPAGPPGGTPTYRAD
jgi:ATP-binding cassette subfamily B protein